MGLGVLCLLTALSAVVFLRSRETKPALQITFLGYTNIVLRTSLDSTITTEKGLFTVTNAGAAQVEISRIEIQPPLGLYVMTKSYYPIDPGKAEVVTTFIPRDETLWRMSLVYFYPDPKKHLVDLFGGRGNFFGRNAGLLADVFFPTQKLHWAHSEWITNPIPRRYNINAPPPPFRFESPTNTGTFP